MLENNLSVIKIVVQIQIRLGNSARTIALRRATAKFQIISYILILFYYLSARSNSVESRQFFFRFPCSVAIEISPLFQTTPVLAKKIMVEGMDVFFPISRKG